MSFYLNADEIFQVGVQIEANGKAFYEAAAERGPESDVGRLCRELATWETKHIELFEGMRRALPPAAREGSAFDPDSDLAAYVRATADSHVFRKNVDVAALASRCRTAGDILDLAIAFEKDSVVFYSAVRNVVAPHQGQSNLDALIEEELRHIAILTKEKAKLSA